MSNIGSWPRAAGARIALLLAVTVAVGCAAIRERAGSAEGRISPMQRDRYLKRAIHESSQGVLFEPSRPAEKPSDGVRLQELARNMQDPAARCFLERAIQTMEAVPEEGGRTVFEDVPDGQLKFRARIGPDGKVMRTEVLESGFKDAGMEQCLLLVGAGITFPPSRQGFSWYVDIYYWVSLGFHRNSGTAEFKQQIRKQSAMASIRAKPCFEGRVKPGRYHVDGLNLFGSEGQTLINRVDRGDLPTEVSGCVVTAFKSVKIDPERDSFIRPAMVAADFEINAEGEVTSVDEEWLRLVLLEERAQREARRRELTGEEAGPVPTTGRGPTPSGPESLESLVDGGVDVPPEPETAEPETDPQDPTPRRDPAKAGKVDLSPRG